MRRGPVHTKLAWIGVAWDLDLLAIGKFSWEGMLHTAPGGRHYVWGA